MRFVVAGTGRSGTTWISRALCDAGVPTGHQTVLGPNRSRTLRDMQSTLLVGDSSLWAGAYLEDLNDLPVVHLVRDPLRVAASWIASRFFASWRRVPSARMIADQVPALDGAADEFGAVLRYVAGWTERLLDGVKGPYRLERLEELAKSPARFAELGSWLGFDLAGTTLPGPVNTRRPRPLSWETIDAHPDGAALREIAARTGY